MKSKQKTFWGIVFIIFILCIILTISYQIVNAPRNNLPFISKAASYVYQTDLKLRNSLLTFEKETSSSYLISSPLNNLLNVVEEIAKSDKNFKSEVENLSGIDKWALDGLDSNLNQYLEINKNVLDGLRSIINFNLKNISTLENFYLLLSRFNDLKLLEVPNFVKSNLSCETIIKTISDFEPFLLSLKLHVQNNTTDLNFQKPIFNFSSFWSNLFKTIELSSIKTSSDKANCDLNDKSIENYLSGVFSVKINPDFNNEDRLYTYLPKTKLYISGLYITNIDNLSNKIDALVDKL